MWDEIEIEKGNTLSILVASPKEATKGSPAGATSGFVELDKVTDALCLSSRELWSLCWSGSEEGCPGCMLLAPSDCNDDADIWEHKQ